MDVRAVEMPPDRCAEDESMREAGAGDLTYSNLRQKSHTTISNAAGI